MDLHQPFYIAGFFLYPLKTSEKLWFTDIISWYKKRPVTWNSFKVEYVQIYQITNKFRVGKEILNKNE